jgi:hypothetical protein
MTAILTSLFRRHCSLHCLLSIVLLAAWQFPALAHAQAATPRLSADTRIATVGFYHLSWKADMPGRVELQEAGNANFIAARGRYRGAERE